MSDEACIDIAYSQVRVLEGNTRWAAGACKMASPIKPMLKVPYSSVQQNDRTADFLGQRWLLASGSMFRNQRAASAHRMPACGFNIVNDHILVFAYFNLT